MRRFWRGQAKIEQMRKEKNAHGISCDIIPREHANMSAEYTHFPLIDKLTGKINQAVMSMKEGAGQARKARRKD